MPTRARPTGRASPPETPAPPAAPRRCARGAAAEAGTEWPGTFRRRAPPAPARSGPNRSRRGPPRRPGYGGRRASHAPVPRRRRPLAPRGPTPPRAPRPPPRPRVERGPRTRVVSAQYELDPSPSLLEPQGRDRASQASVADRHQSRQPGIVGEVGSRSHARALYGASADLSGSGTLRHCSGVSTARACWSARRMLWLSTSSESAIACSTATCSAERPSESRNDMIRAIGLASGCRAGVGEPESGVAAAPSGPAVARRSDARSRSRMRLGPRVRRASRPIWKGTVTPPFPALLAPKRPLTAYRNRAVAGSNPRTYSSTGSGADAYPHPCRLPAPWSHSSSPPIRFTVSTESVSRRSSPNQAGRQLSCRSNDGCHGPAHEFRAATRASCLTRHRRTAPGASAIRVRIAFPTAVSGAVAGTKMNARSLRAPSPLMSDPTTGVNGAPDVSRPMAPSSRALAIGRVTVARKAWRRSRSLVAHSRTFGSAAVVGAANPWDAAQHANDD